MKTFFYTAIYFLLSYNLIFGQAISEKYDLNPDRWQRHSKHDGYVLGNGKMYVIAGLGKELTRSGKSRITSTDVDFNRIAWVIGPTYSVGNLGYGWEPVPIVNQDTIAWENQQINVPDEENKFWGITSRHPQLEISCRDILVTTETVFIREINVKNPSASKKSNVRIFLPVYSDPRNGYYGMYNGQEIDEEQVERWKEVCGPNLKPRSSIPQEKLKIIDKNSGCIVLNGVNRALYQEISTIVPDDDIYKKLFPYRAAATGVKAGSKSKVTVDESGFSIDLGTLEPNGSRKLYLYIVTEKLTDSDTEKKVKAKLEQWKQKDVAEIVNNESQSASDFLFSTKANDDFLLTSINSCISLITTCKPEFGGAMAQPYMYPMYYVRDQYGPYKLFLAAGEYEKAYNILTFYIAKQNHEGIQNAHDLFAEPKDPTTWLPDANSKNGHHAAAEVPSYIILMARDYFMATGDIEHLKPLYPRLKYNLHVQEPSVNGVLPYATDESYTNFSQSRPKFKDEMTDSQLLFIAAANFMKELAVLLGKEEDSAEFDSMYNSAKKALFERMWLPEKNYFVYTRDASNNLTNIDKRPAFDALLRWFYLEMGSPNDSVPQSNLNTVLGELTNPIRIVPEWEWCTGMDLGYLLYALSRSQHPLAHQAADLMLDYASDLGLYSEYYGYAGDSIILQGGTLRPWESSVNGVGLIQYLSGLRLDMPNNKIYLQPHLPKGWDNWKTKEYPLYIEGVLQIELKKENNEVTCLVKRKGGNHALDVDLEFGLFGDKLMAMDNKLQAKDRQQNILSAKTTLQPSKDWEILEFRFKTE